MNKRESGVVIMGRLMQGGCLSIFFLASVSLAQEDFMAELSTAYPAVVSGAPVSAEFDSAPLSLSKESTFFAKVSNPSETRRGRLSKDQSVVPSVEKDSALPFPEGFDLEGTEKDDVYEEAAAEHQRAAEDL